MQTSKIYRVLLKMNSVRPHTHRHVGPCQVNYFRTQETQLKHTDAHSNEWHMPYLCKHMCGWKSLHVACVCVSSDLCQCTCPCKYSIYPSTASVWPLIIIAVRSSCVFQVWKYTYHSMYVVQPSLFTQNSYYIV